MGGIAAGALGGGLGGLNPSSLAGTLFSPVTNEAVNTTHAFDIVDPGIRAEANQIFAQGQGGVGGGDFLIGAGDQGPSIAGGGAGTSIPGDVSGLFPGASNNAPSLGGGDFNLAGLFKHAPEIIRAVQGNDQNNTDDDELARLMRLRQRALLGGGSSGGAPNRGGNITQIMRLLGS